MINLLCRLFGCTAATAAVETAIFAPIFLTLTLGVTDLGSGMFWRMTVNAAAQAGAAYAVLNSGSTCATLTTTCLNNIKTAMNDATGNPAFCTGSVCTASMPTPCAGGPSSSKCITVSANYPCNTANKCLILPISTGSFAHPWTQTQTYSSTATIRIQ
jgi:Flp pilus assembly protein TadG